METKIELIRSNRKTTVLEVTRTGRVILRAPKRASKQALDAFVKDKQAWIETQLAKQAAARAARPDPTPAETDALKQLAKKVLPERVAYYAERMQLYPTGIRIPSRKILPPAAAVFI